MIPGVANFVWACLQGCDFYGAVAPAWPPKLLRGRLSSILPGSIYFGIEMDYHKVEVGRSTRIMEDLLVRSHTAHQGMAAWGRTASALDCTRPRSLRRAMT